jgi:hypothetical protein
MSAPRVMWTRTVPLDGWLAWLASGWQLPFVVEPIGGHHGYYSILLVREDEPS